MGSIHMLPHELLGFLGGYPVSRPLEDVIGSNNPGPGDAWSCTTRQLIIGGVTDDPGLVVTNLRGCAARYLERQIEAWGSETTGGLKRAIRFLRPLIEDGLKCGSLDVFDFRTFTLDDHAAFYSVMNRLSYGRIESREVGYEEFLEDAVGEFLVLALPDMVYPLTKEMRHIYNVLNSSFQTVINMPLPDEDTTSAWIQTRRNKFDFDQ